ncbi:MAG: patatin-like phospholipase family protein, partial [Rhodothermia bacterium]|nr:patatin-like phospholipase family protein [Rhodothermia bacterium]
MVTSTLDKLRILVGLDDRPEQYGLLLSGGGARASYQAGVLRYIADHFPEADFENLTGVSAGAINAAFLSNTAGSLSDSADQLVKNWEDIRAEHVFASESSFSFFRGLVFRKSPGVEDDGNGPAMLDTGPLRQFLRDCLNPEDDVITGISRKLHAGRLRAVAIVTTNYATGQTVTWVQGRNISRWERPTRVGINTTLTVEHIMA